jgi:hypothetical protein
MLAVPPAVIASPSSPSVPTLTQSQSGLQARDPLTSGASSDWTFLGDAPAEEAPYSYMENGTGLYVGVQSPSSPNWAGFFGVSPPSDVMLFHAVLTLPYTSTSEYDFNTGLYVQTTAAFVDYITCYAQVTPAGYYWGVLYTSGSAHSAETFTQLYLHSGGPLTQDCTIVTNGQNMLRVYLQGELVYSSDTLNLGMPAPFRAYLEVESSDGSRMLYGRFTDYYSTMSDKVQVENAPPGDTVTLVGFDDNASGGSNLITSAAAEVAPNGTASIPIGQYHLPIVGSLVVRGSDQQVAVVSSTADIWGGDVYQMNGYTQTPVPPPSPPPSGLVATKTTVICGPSVVSPFALVSCSATASSPAGLPAGVISFSNTGTGDFGIPTCSSPAESMTCYVYYEPTSPGAQTITAAFSGSQQFAPSNGTAQILVTG